MSTGLAGLSRTTIKDCGSQQAITTPGKLLLIPVDASTTTEPPLEFASMSNPTVNVNTTQPLRIAELLSEAAEAEGVEKSPFVGAAIVDRAIKVLGLNRKETLASIPVRGRGRPVRYDSAKAPAVKRKRGRVNG